VIKLSDAEGAAHRILSEGPDAAVRRRLLRDVLRRPAGDPELIAARNGLDGSRWVRLLAREQRVDGGWGRFHTMDTKVQQKVRTTEAGVARAVALGLDVSHPILSKASRYITRILKGATAFPDGAEKNDCWLTGAEIFSAATLAQIEAGAAALDGAWNLWEEIANRAFARGDYNLDAELRAHRSLTGRSGRCKYLRLNNRYAVGLLGVRAAQLDRRIERAYLAWLWNNPAGLGYLGAPLSSFPDAARPLRVDTWLSSLELLSLYPSWRGCAGKAIAWLWSKRRDGPAWDLGPRSWWSSWFPLSEDWRRRGNRSRDYTTRVLILLRKYLSE